MVARAAFFHFFCMSDSLLLQQSMKCGQQRGQWIVYLFFGEGDLGISMRILDIL